MKSKQVATLIHSFSAGVAFCAAVYLGYQGNYIATMWASVCIFYIVSLIWTINKS